MDGLYLPGGSGAEGSRSTPIKLREPKVVRERTISSLSVAPPPRVTRRSEKEEERLTREFMPMVRLAAKRREAYRPTLWVDGPTDMAFTAYVLARGEKRTSNDPGHTFQENNLGEWGLERLHEARKRVAALPKELRQQMGSDQRNHSAKMLVEGNLKKYFDAKAKTARSIIPKEYASLTRSVPPAMAPQEENHNQLNGIAALLGNQNQLLLAGMDRGTGWGSTISTGYFNRDSYNSLKGRIGEDRAATQAAITLMVLEARRAALNRNGSAPVTAHEFFNFNLGQDLTLLRWLHGLLREGSMGSNWNDPDAEFFEDAVHGCSGHVPFSTMDIMCRAPTRVDMTMRELTMDNVEQALSTPSVAWADGTSFHFYDGIEIDPKTVRQAVKNPATLLSVRNVEQRRALLRMVGNKALLASVNATEVSKDEFGTLYVLPNNTQFVIVQNATPEPDGSVKQYVLGTIGNKHKTARSGVASTWGLTAEQYWPVRET